MLNDLRFAWRMIPTHRWFSVAVVVTLALGIDVNTTVFTLVNAALFKPVPLPGGERLVFLMMLGAVAFVLLIACANVANMLLSGRSRAGARFRCGPPWAPRAGRSSVSC